MNQTATADEFAAAFVKCTEGNLLLLLNILQRLSGC